MTLYGESPVADLVVIYVIFNCVIGVTRLTSILPGGGLIVFSYLTLVFNMIIRKGPVHDFL